MASVVSGVGKTSAAISIPNRHAILLSVSRSLPSELDGAAQGLTCFFRLRRPGQMVDRLQQDVVDQQS
jgi:hypothetical protein